VSRVAKCRTTDGRRDHQSRNIFAIEEHARWNDERTADGWKLDRSLADGDPVRKLTPYLVPWKQLPPSIAKYDLDFVEAIPAILASAGLQVVRTTELTQRLSHASP